MQLCGRGGKAVLAGWVWLALMPGLPAWALDVPSLSGPVVDVAHVLPPATVEQLSQELRAHEAKTSNQVAVLIVPSLGGEPLFDFSHRVATTWKLGRKGTDNGVLLLVALKDRKIRLEVGYGLEGVLTDARSAQIIRNEIVPRFRTGEFAAGVTAGVRAVLSTIEGTDHVPERPSPSPSGSDRLGQVLSAVIVGVVIGLVFSRTHRMLGPVVGGGVSFIAAPWLLPALIAGGVSLLLVSLLGGWGLSAGPRRGHRTSGFDETWFSTHRGGWGSGDLSGSFGGGDSFSGSGGDFGGGGASGDW
ncbi:MAG: TPM domain-containing protein [Nitrospira sp.]|nr:TPM domain-containing protein [Nitrospira sp.]MCW5786663.1 TPM domain-containing protein [Nitrospira sp.]MDR4474641.1 TPM domain-containing protein [Nitrospira sp.]